MGFEDYISEVEASALVGVSPATLCRFAEAGYLQVEQDADGLRLFSKGELAAVFSVDVGGATDKESSLTADERSTDPSPIEPLDTSSAQSPVETADANEESAEDPAQAAEHLAADSENDRSTGVPAGTSHDPRAVDAAQAAPYPESQSVTPAISPVKSPSETPSLPNSASPALPNSASPARGQVVSEGANGDREMRTKIASLEEERLRQERDLTRFRHLVDMQERLLDLYERQIKEMRTERDWLRQRVERSEEKHDRDQLLLLSETQTIRKLVAHQENRKSSLQYALEWFGFASTSPQAPRPASSRPSQRLAASIESSRTPPTRPQPMSTTQGARPIDQGKGVSSSERESKRS